jgi:3-phenylpropionate/trans-cinnamate dioxygenase ferredoxin reductase subunit
MADVAATTVIVGGGQAGGEVAAELRKLGYEGRVVIVSEESQPPYRRPPLSKAYLAGSVTQDSLFMMKGENLEKNRIEFIGGTRVESIDRAAKQLKLANGDTLAYDALALTTGGRARPLPLPGADLANVFLLRTIDDVDAIRPHCGEGKRAVIVGGGFIGLEVAAVLRKQGMTVTVVEFLPRVLARVTAPEVSAFFERVHGEEGVDVRTGIGVQAFEGEGRVERVRLADGTAVEADLVIGGIGIIPNVDLAEAAGLAIDNGILVDEYSRTSDPAIYSAGDCTDHPSEFLGRRVRLESVQNAMEQGRNVARNIMGRNEAYQMVPWFWSDQYELKLQMVGISTGYDQLVLRGDPSSERSFSAFYLKDGALIAADAISRPQDFMFAKKLVAMKAELDPAQLADPEVPIKNLVPAA